VNNNNIRIFKKKKKQHTSIVAKQTLYYGTAFSQGMEVSNYSLEKKWE